MTNHLNRKTIVEIPPIFGIDMSITHEVLLLWLAAAVTFILLFMACRRSQMVAKGFLQNLFESLIEFVDNEIVSPCINKKDGAWGIFITSLFFFILFANLMGLVPVPTLFKSVTSNINITAALALGVFASTIAVSINRKGFKGFLKRFVPDGTSGLILMFIIPIEVISWLARPFSLALRLFANMLAGHTLILVFVGMTVTVPFSLKPLPFAGAVLMNCFEIFACFIQAFIFAMLSALYLKEAMEDAH